MLGFQKRDFDVILCGCGSATTTAVGHSLDHMLALDSTLLKSGAPDALRRVGGKLPSLKTRSLAGDHGNPRVLAFWEGGAVERPLFPKARFVVGRGEGCDVRIDHASVSRRHAMLEFQEDVRLIDLGSSNGTRIGGRRIAQHESVTLSPGTLVEVGAAILLLRGESGEGPASVAPGALADPMEPILRLAQHVARSSISVILLGETGSGKEVMAERIHRASARSERPLVKVNCAALPEALLEAELFGFERGAFTGALQQKQGLVETAQGGTLFLDEVGELPLAIQVKLLRLVENREVVRLGAVKARKIDVRFLAATNRNLDALVADGRFREDLYYRLNGISIALPPLRERRAEMARLAREFAERACLEVGRAPLVVSREAMALLAGHAWPGNVRELRNVIERAVVLADGPQLLAAHLSGLQSEPLRSRPSETASSLAPSIERTLPDDVADIERTRIFEALERFGGNQTKAAEALGISRRTLLRRLDEYAVRRPRKPSGSS